MPRHARPWFRKPRNMFYITWNGQQIPLGVTGPDTPENQAKALEAAQRLCASPAAGIALTDAVAQFLARSEHRVSTATLTQYRWFLKCLTDSFPGVVLTALTPHAVERTSHKVSWSASTRHDYLGCVGTFLRDAGYPLKLRRPPQSSRGADAVWTVSEFDRVYGAARGDLKPLLLVLRDTGARPSEITRLTVENVDWGNRLSRPRQHKNAAKGKPRVIHFPDAAHAVLCEQRRQYEKGFLFRNEDDEPFKANTLHVRVASARERAGVTRAVTLYGLRHSFITRALALGVSADKVAALVGNSPQVITKFYGHIGEDAELMKSVAERVANRAG